MKGQLLTVKDCENLSLEKIKEIYRKNVSPSLAEILDSFSFSTEIIESAEGVWLHTRSGKKILDVTGGGGVLNLGHNPASVLAERIAFQQQKHSEVHKSFFSPYLAALAHNISCLMPGDLNYSYFCNSGAEAIEGALKIAYKFHEGKRDIVLHSDIAFHGKLLATGNLTAKPKKEFRFQSTLRHECFTYNDLSSVKELIEKNKNQIYALVVEPFSASHLRGLSPEFLQGIRSLCDQHEIILIFDEVYTGWYKTGPMLSFMHTNVVPDVVTVSKSLGGGKATISAYVCTDRVMHGAYRKVKDALLHSTTYNGYAEECITAIEILNLLQRPEISSRPYEIEKHFQLRIEKLRTRYPDLVERFSGRGALQGITLKTQRSVLDTALRLLPTSMIMGDYFVEKLVLASVIDRLFTKYQVYCQFVISAEPSILFTPSLVIKNQEIDLFFDALEDVLSVGTSELVMDFVKRKLLKKISGAS